MSVSSIPDTARRVIDWVKPTDTDHRGISLERAGKGALVGGVMTGTLAAVGGFGLSWWKPQLGINAGSFTLRAAAVGAIGLGEIGALSTMRLPGDRDLATLAGTGLGAAAIGGGGTMIATAVSRRVLGNLNALGGIAFGLAAVGAAGGAVVGLAGRSD
jgi:hypothetical protein